MKAGLTADVAQFHSIQTAGSRNAVQYPEFSNAITVLGKLKTAISRTDHAFAFAKYADCYLAELQYRVIRRLDSASVFTGGFERLQRLGLVLHYCLGQLRFIANHVMPQSSRDFLDSTSVIFVSSLRGCLQNKRITGFIFQKRVSWPRADVPGRFRLSIVRCWWPSLNRMPRPRWLRSATNWPAGAGSGCRARRSSARCEKPGSSAASIARGFGWKHLRKGPRRYGYTPAHRRQEPEQTYPSCVTDAEWALVGDLFDHEGGRGLPPQYERRHLVDACCYVVRTGCSWRMLPTTFPKWQNVYRTFRRWSDQRKFEQMHDRLRAQWREREGRAAEPTAAVIDAQSTRSSPQGGEHGYDAGKKVKGRKRHLVVDSLGLLLAVSVTAASVQDRDGAHPVIAATMAKYPCIETLFADSAYAGQCAQTVSQCHGIQVQVVRHPANKNVGRWVRPEQLDLFTVQADSNGFVVLAKRWVVERTHAWNERARRLVMHHDRLPRISEAWVWLTEARLLLRRLTT